MTQTIQLWVEDKPGVLMRVVGIITAKGANIQSLSARPDSGQAGISQVTLVAEIDPRLNVRVVKEMNRLVQVLEAVDVS
ncbi:MAG TPA: acetolactate synthase small subunit, partial [Solibacterales bacterium]|nr:acetolactate synthase small subunit [Bryobacterales bacterium]